MMLGRQRPQRLAFQQLSCEADPTAQLLMRRPARSWGEWLSVGEATTHGRDGWKSNANLAAQGRSATVRLFQTVWRVHA